MGIKCTEMHHISFRAFVSCLLSTHLGLMGGSKGMSTASPGTVTRPQAPCLFIVLTLTIKKDLVDQLRSEI